MTILTTIARAATVIGLNVPTTVFGATDRELVELQDISNEVAEQITNAYDWQALKTLATLAGDGVTQDYPLPSDYSRQLLKATLWVASRPFYPLEHVPDTDQWLGIVASGLVTAIGQWTLYGNQIHIRPAMAAGDSAKFYYITKNRVQAASGPNKNLFTLDTDTFLISERVLRLGIIWNWKSNKGLPYSEDMQSYEIALAEAVSRDKGSKAITVGLQRVRSGIGSDYAFPGMVTP